MPSPRPVTDGVIGVAAGQHLADDLVDREAVDSGRASPMSPGSLPWVPLKPSGSLPQMPAARNRQNLALGKGFRIGLECRPFERVGRDEPVTPHLLTPPRGCCSSPTGNSMAAGTPVRHDAVVRDSFEELLHHDGDLLACHVDAETEMLGPCPKDSSRSMGRFQMKASGSSYSRSSRAAEANGVMTRCPGSSVVS